MVACSRSPEARSEEFLSRGKQFLEQKDYARAILEFKNASVLTPTNAEPYYELALCYEGLGEILGSAQNLLKTLELDPNHKEARVKLAALYANSGDPELHKEAQQHASEVLALDPNNVGALDVLALAEFKLGNSGTATELLRKAIDEFSDLSASVSLANIHLRDGDTKAAEQVLLSAVSQRPKEPLAYTALGRFYVFAKRLDEAEQAFQKAVELDPKNGNSLLDLGILQSDRKEMDRADATFRQLAGLGPERYASVHAVFLLQTGHQDAGIQELKQQYEAKPDSRERRSRLIQAYLGLGRQKDAESLLDAALKQNEKDIDALQQRAMLALLRGDPRAATRDLTTVITEDPVSAKARYLLARSALAQGSRTIYEQQLGEAVRRDPKLLPARLELSAALRTHPGGAKASLDLLAATPEEQKLTPDYIAELNWARISAGDFSIAEASTAEALKGQRTATFLMQDAVLKLQQKKMDAARQELVEAAQKAPDDLRPVQLLAASYLQEKQILKSQQVVREYASKVPNSARAQLLLGAWLEATGDNQGALQAYTDGAKLDSGSGAAQIARAKLLASSGEDQAALQAFLEIPPTQRTAEVMASLGVLEDRNARRDEARKYYREALQLDPNNVQALNNLSWILLNDQQTEEALKLAQHAQQIAPDESDVNDTLGLAMYQKGLYPSAVGLFEQAVGKQQNPVHQYHLAMAYARSGQVNKAEQTYRTAYAKNPGLPEATLAQKAIAEAANR